MSFESRPGAAPGSLETTDYVPIDCSLHDRLEAVATLRRAAVIVYEDDAGAAAETRARIDDVFARAGAEYLRTEGGLELRLDRVLSVDGVRYRTPGAAPAAPDLEVRPPRSRADVVSELTRLAAEVARLVESFDTPAFFAAQSEGGEVKWSPAEQVRHLTRSTYPLARAFAMPRLALALRFGVTLRGGGSYEDVAARYTRYLETRPDSGRFGPGRDELAHDDARRAEIMARWRDAVSRLAAAVERWPERALDRYRLPHPLMGAISTREMLHFTLFHTSHHARQVGRRRNLPS